MADALTVADIASGSSNTARVFFIVILIVSISYVVVLNNVTLK
jgi:hypothetical protein